MKREEILTVSAIAGNIMLCSDLDDGNEDAILAIYEKIAKNDGKEFDGSLYQRRIHLGYVDVRLNRDEDVADQVREALTLELFEVLVNEYNLTEDMILENVDFDILLHI